MTLTAKITGNKRKRLTISIPLGTLKYAFKWWPNNVNDEGDEPGYRVIDDAAFMKAVRDALHIEEEDGSNRIHKMLDEAFERVLEDCDSGTEEIRKGKAHTNHDAQDAGEGR